MDRCVGNVDDDVDSDAEDCDVQTLLISFFALERALHKMIVDRHPLVDIVSTVLGGAERHGSVYSYCCIVLCNTSSIGVM